MKPWWERVPGRLESETAALDEWGVRWQLDPDEFSNDQVVIRVWVDIDGTEVSLTARHPDAYPYTHVEVMSEDLTLEHHQNPFGKNLCLLGQSTDNWDPGADSLASLLRTQLPLVVSTGTTNDDAAAHGLEEQQGEPVSSFYTYLEDAAVLIDGSWAIDPDATGGSLSLGFLKRSPTSWLGAVLEVRDRDGNALAAIDPRIKMLFPKTITGRWVRSPETLIENDPNQIRRLISKLDPDLGVEKLQPASPTDSLDIVGILQPEELEHRKSSDGRLFAASQRTKNTQTSLFEKYKYLVRADRAGAADLGSRIPELAPLRTRTVAVAGIGCIGAPAAIHLAKSGIGELRIVDGDNVESGPTVRWPLGISVAGMSKVKAIREFLGAHYPLSKVVPVHHRIGSALPQKRRDNEVLAELFDGADLLYDASAERGIQLLLSDLAREYRIPYICTSTTHGGWGGIVARVWPDAQKGCWGWLQYSLFTDKTVPLPPEDPSPFFQPAGCGSPTFRAASFDVEEVSLVGARTAASTLCAGSPGGYPEQSWDVAVISLRDAKGRPIEPLVQTFPLERNDRCKNHPA